jgi:hypothetical protein
VLILIEGSLFTLWQVVDVWFVVGAIAAVIVAVCLRLNLLSQGGGLYAECSEQCSGQIRPTVFIGLGGTGKEVLLSLRRKVYEKFCKPSLPCASFLWVDTGTGGKDARS